MREVYLNYCETYFNRNTQKDIEEKINIKRAYDYMESMIKNIEKTYRLKNEIIGKLLVSYGALTLVIAEYRFNAHWKGSYGFNQTITSKRISFEISLLESVLRMALENIEAHFKKIKEVSEISLFDNQLRERLEKFIEQFDNQLREIIAAKNIYQDMWNSVKHGEFYRIQGCTNTDLGIAKLNWKVAKNNGCHAILEFCKQIMEINMTLPKEDMIHSPEEIQKAYNDGMANITKGPNYYSYLSEEEKETITKQNILRKQERKK